MHSDTSMYRVFIPARNNVVFTRAADFKPQNKDEIPDIASLIDGITRQRALDEANQVPSEAEEHLEKNIVAFIARVPHLCLSSKRKRVDPDVPRSFAEACKDPRWCVAIDREYNALVKRGTWEFVDRTKKTRPVPYT